jgi:predicted dehydrogenase
LRVLITGAGSIGLRHAVNLRRLLPTATLAVVSTSPELRHPFIDLGLTHIKSWAEALSQIAHDAFDLAVICSRTDLHGSEIDRLMQSGCALYVEKPVVIDGRDLERIKSRFLGGWSAPSVVGCNLRFHGAVNKLKEAISAGEVGKVVRASFSVGQWLPDWRPQRIFHESYSRHRRLGGGVLYDLVHELDSAVYLFGPIEDAQAVAGRMTDLTHDSDDSATMSLLMQSGLPVQVSLDYVARQPIREYVVVGTQATLTLDFQKKILHRVDARGTNLIGLQDSDWQMDLTYVTAMCELLRGMRNSAATRYSLADAMHTTEWMIKLEQCALRKKTYAIVSE